MADIHEYPENRPDDDERDFDSELEYRERVLHDLATAVTEARHLMSLKDVLIFILQDVK